MILYNSVRFNTKILTPEIIRKYSIPFEHRPQELQLFPNGSADRSHIYCMPHVAEHPELINDFLTDLENAWKINYNNFTQNTSHIPQNNIIENDLSV